MKDIPQKRDTTTLNVERLLDLSPVYSRLWCPYANIVFPEPCKQRMKNLSSEQFRPSYS